MSLYPIFLQTILGNSLLLYVGNWLDQAHAPNQMHATDLPQQWLLSLVLPLKHSFQSITVGITLLLHGLGSNSSHFTLYILIAN